MRLKCENKSGEILYKAIRRSNSNKFGTHTRIERADLPQKNFIASRSMLWILHQLPNQKKTMLCQHRTYAVTLNWRGKYGVDI